MTIPRVQSSAEKCIQLLSDTLASQPDRHGNTEHTEVSEGYAHQCIPKIKRAASNHQCAVHIKRCREGYVMKNSRDATTKQCLLNGFNLVRELINDLILWVCSLAKSVDWRNPPFLCSPGNNISLAPLGSCCLDVKGLKAYINIKLPITLPCKNVF